MNADNSIPTLQKAVLDDILQKISDAVSDSEKVSKEKYEAKLKLILSSTDMSTQEKHDAMDKNYDRRMQECWQNVLIFAVVLFSVLGLAAGSPIAVKTMRKLIAT